jgi:hypothetical protein
MEWSTWPRCGGREFASVFEKALARSRYCTGISGGATEVVAVEPLAVAAMAESSGIIQSRWMRKT